MRRIGTTRLSWLRNLVRGGGKKLGIVAAAVLQLLVCVSAARAQFTGACCFPVNQTCAIMSPYDCVQAGGDFLGLSSTCPTTNACDRKQHFGVGMSQVAARRLLREGVVHTLLVSDPIAVYESEHPMWNLVNYGVVIAPEIRVNPLETADPDPEISLEDSAEYAAELALWRAEEARSAFTTAHPGKPFHWSLHVAGLGTGWRWQVAEDSHLPVFANHWEDVAANKLGRHDYVDQWGYIGEVLEGEASFTVLEQIGDSPWNRLAQFTGDFYTDPWEATLSISYVNGSGLTVTRSAAITAFNPSTRQFTLDDAILEADDETFHRTFTIRRTDDNYPQGLLPCYFFKKGAAVTGTWVQTFCDYMENNWPEGLPPPAAVIISDEDMGEASIDWDNYKDYLADPRADDALNGYTIDGNFTLAAWHDQYAPSSFDEFGNYTPTGSKYSPQNEEGHSYLLATLQTAYNYHREQSTWQYFRALWPKARLSQYQLGNGYGVDESIATAVPIGPGEDSFDGQRTWLGPVSWDEYNSGLTFSPGLWDPIGDGQVVPVTYGAADCAEGTALAGSELDKVPVDLFGPPCSNSSGDPYNPDPHVGSAFPVYIEFLAGSANHGVIREATIWSHGVLTLDDDLPNLTSAGDKFFVYFPTVVPYVDHVANNVDWPMIKTFCDRYEEDIDAAGLIAAAKKWAAECARAQTRALPDNPYSVYYAPGRLNGDYDGVQERLSTVATYPAVGFATTDGWMDGADWGEIGSQAIDYGVNHFVWFMPYLVTGCDDPLEDDCHSLGALSTAIYTMDTHLYNNLAVYTNIACIGDWDMNEEIDVTDAQAFGAAVEGLDPLADLNNDGLFNQDDIDIYNSMFCGGGCAPIDDPGCTNQENCELVDWNEDGNSGVEDIFAFLTDWIANETDAYNFGGTPGVPAIFAFLTMWFTVGVGPCDP